MKPLSIIVLFPTLRMGVHIAYGVRSGPKWMMTKPNEVCLRFYGARLLPPPNTRLRERMSWTIENHASIAEFKLLYHSDAPTAAYQNMMHIWMNRELEQSGRRIVFLQKFRKEYDALAEKYL